MDQHKNQQGQDAPQNRGEMQQGGPGGGQRNRDQAEGDRDTARTNAQDSGGERNLSNDDMGGDQMGTERNGRVTASRDQHSTGISNRGMDGMSEQDDLPPRGSTRESER
jgi:hypothetical protein